MGDLFEVEFGPSFIRTRAVLGWESRMLRENLARGRTRADALAEIEEAEIAEAEAERQALEEMDPEEREAYERFRDAREDWEAADYWRWQVPKPDWSDADDVADYYIACAEMEEERRIYEEEMAEEEAIALTTMEPEERVAYLAMEKRRRDEIRRRKEAGRGANGLTAKSKNELWLRVHSLPWEKLGDQPVMVTLTAPREWRRWWKDGRAFQGDVDAFVERWAAYFGERPMGLWVKEFQPRERMPLRQQGAPHLHMLVKLPDSVGSEDYESFRERTLLGKRLERMHGVFEGRAKTPPIGGEFGGTTADELKRWWSEIVTGAMDESHGRRGVDVRAVFYVEGAEMTARARVAGYLAMEASKWRQKRPPYGYEKVGRYWGVWPGKDGEFKPETQRMRVDAVAFKEVTRRINRWQNWRREIRRRKGVVVGGPRRRWDVQGATLGGIGPQDQARLLGWALAAADRKRGRTDARSP
jgi:hypothetical protein